MFRGSYNNIIAWLIVCAAAVLSAAVAYWGSAPTTATVLAIAGVILGASPRMLNEWERGILLRLGKYQRVVTPGIIWVVPGIDQIAAFVDMRIRSTPFSAEKTLTRDTVPVDVDAVLFWVVTDAQKAVLEVEHYEPTVTWAAQTTLRDIIGRNELHRMISDREGLDRELQAVIDAKTTEWGITVQSVEIRDVRIPAALEDAMSRKAQADREREARVILAESETRVAAEMVKAAHTYQEEQFAMQLRAMNMAYESVKERGALMVIPSGMADAMNTGVIGLAAAGYRVERPVKEDQA